MIAGILLAIMVADYAEPLASRQLGESDGIAIALHVSCRAIAALFSSRSCVIQHCTVGLHARLVTLAHLPHGM